jgi:hypothetical protein
VNPLGIDRLKLLIALSANTRGRIEFFSVNLILVKGDRRLIKKAITD